MPTEDVKNWKPFAHNPLVLYILAVAAVALVTAGLFVCQRLLTAHEHVPYVRPYGIVFVAPVAMLTALGGVRVGLATLLLSGLSLEYVLFAPHFSWRVSHDRDWAELALLLCVGGFVTYSMDAVRRNGELSAETRQARARLEASETRRLDFTKEVLLAVTGGRLLLCDRQDLRGMARGAPALSRPLREAADATGFRRSLRSLVTARGMEDAVRLDDALTAAMEAATNAVKHGRDAEACAWLDADEITVLISDRGAGIQPHDLARATLEAGFSSQATLGMGYHLMLQTVDLLALSTSEDGTDVLLRVGGRLLASVEQQFLARFSLESAA